MGSFKKEYSWLIGMKGKDVARLKQEIEEKAKVKRDLARANKNISKICKDYGLKDIVRGKLGKKRSY
jgi:hypothetical protein